MALVNAPDGSLLIVDMYRGILESYGFITSYLHEQILSRGLDKPTSGLGRIWKLTYVGGPLPAFQPDRLHQDCAGLAKLLADPNGWWRDSAQQEIVERGDQGAVPVLQELAAHGSSAATRVAALWTLDGLNATTLEILRPALVDPSAKVRSAAVRMHERWLRSDLADQAMKQLSPVLDDPAPEVSVQLALTLGEAKTPAALELMGRLFLADGDHPFMPKAIASGLAGREFPFIERIAGGLEAEPRPEVKTALALLAASLVHGNDPASIQHLLASMGDGGTLPKWARVAVLESLESLAAPSAPRFSVPPGSLKPAMLATLEASHDPDIKAGSTRLAEELDQAEQEARRRLAEAKPLNADEQETLRGGKDQSSKSAPPAINLHRDRPAPRRAVARGIALGGRQPGGLGSHRLRGKGGDAGLSQLNAADRRSLFRRTGRRRVDLHPQFLGSPRGRGVIGHRGESPRPSRRPRRRLDGCAADAGGKPVGQGTAPKSLNVGGVNAHSLAFP